MSAEAEAGQQSNIWRMETDQIERGVRQFPPPRERESPCRSLMKRGSGILLHITSLPGPFGVGTFGSEAYSFVDSLHSAEQIYWQVLPCNPPGYGDSPYQSTSAFAGNPTFIDPVMLVHDGLIDSSDLEPFMSQTSNGPVADYGVNHRLRPPLLRKAAERGLVKFHDEFEAFNEAEAYWLEDFALFDTFHAYFKDVSFENWPKPIRDRSEDAVAELAAQLASEIECSKFTQFLFTKQWMELKNYANHLGVSIIGDMPIYVAPDSAERWSRPDMFRQDGSTAGVPADALCLEGQAWGNPLYNWQYLAEHGYDWWVQRVKHDLTRYDYLRFDHFRGIEAFFVVPAGGTPLNGHWEKGPGRGLIDALRENIGELPIIAEDLGYITPEVRELLAYTGFAGTQVLQLAWADPPSSSLPYEFKRNCAVYTGTHDNNTTRGWYADITDRKRDWVQQYVGPVTDKTVARRFIREAMLSVGDCCITPAQDLLNLGSWARMNTPSVPTGNWLWRMVPGELTTKILHRLRRLTRVSGRGSSEFQWEDKPEDTAAAAH